MKGNHTVLALDKMNLPVAEAIVEASIWLGEISRMEADIDLTATERRALQSAIRELKKIIQHNVC
jgi:hypothetical protein